MAETVNTSVIAPKAASQIFDFFKWNFRRIGPADTNYECIFPNEHSSLKKDSEDFKKHTHPTDAVFFYEDPYFHKNIYFNVDFKSYSDTSISLPKVRNAVNSMARAIQCARSSTEWSTRYMVKEPFEVRGFLFAYNHDNSFEKNFYSFFNVYDDFAEEDDKKGKINPFSLKLAKGQKIHIADPELIHYWQTVVINAKQDITNEKMGKKYFFHYPQLVEFRNNNDKFINPATIEMLSGPFIIIGYDEINRIDDSYNVIRIHGKGYYIYYREKGETYEEFIYLLDFLDKFQLIETNVPIKIKFANRNASKLAISNFNNAKERFQHDVWGKQSNVFDLISAEFCELFTQEFSTEQIGWERAESET
ncbi:hypothetical protein ACT4VW_00705 [Acinetobacter baumannii]|uniref:hypothetical protein n=1 Tax=Acinetobacter baumannii TaxID=470 RepID=UPI0004DB9758|nr:hypothetical protein [Acinetobacter baumannii]MDC5556925.1 hypothetical protein [Acinetobacter baumannii]MDO7522859.1 hypothetical protein [Acinetobacter baumannii]